MLPLPDLVNREDGTYLLEGSGNDGVKFLVTSENWATLRFNTKSMNPEYFPSSYLEPVPTDPVNKELSKRGYAADAKTFPRSTITVRIQTVRLRLVRGLHKKHNPKIYPTSYPCSFTGTSEHKEERWRYKEKQE
jgi:hypothetical protein